MREIKFRYRFENIETGERLTAFMSLGMIENRGYVPNVFNLEWTMLSRDEFTGLHDKNGKEIWEGDIFKRNNHYGYVVYRYGGFYVKFDDGKVIFLFSDIKWNWEADETEVIGNIYENPELLEG